jgi:CHAD domain-containing protein
MAHDHRIKGIDCEGAAAVGIHKALNERFEEMSRLRREAVKWKDPEGVHSMRVASRRLRSALSDFMPHVNKRSLSSILKQIRSIADALGEVRDQDVAILALEKLESETPPEFFPTLQKLIDARKEIRRTSRQELKRILVKDRMKELGDDFDNALTAATRLKGGMLTSSPYSHSYKDVAKAIIRDRLVELETLSTSLYQPFEAAQLHEMRIGAKRLRYAVEMFASCWDSDIVLFAKSCARLQGALGRLHDCDVWIQSFRQEIQESEKIGLREQTEAFAWLFTHFNDLRHSHFQESFSLWKTWEADQLSEKLREALKSN